MRCQAVVAEIEAAPLRVHIACAASLIDGYELYPVSTSGHRLFAAANTDSTNAVPTPAPR